GVWILNEVLRLITNNLETVSDNENSKHVFTGERVAAEQSISLQHQGLDEEMKTCSPSEQGSVESEVAILDEIQSGVSAATTSALAGESLDDNDATGNRNIDVTIESDEVFDSSNSSAINGHLNLNLNCPPKEGQKLDNEEITPFANSAANSEFSNSEFEKLESSGLLESSSEHVFCDTENDDSLENSSSTTIVSKSCQTCSIDLLENSIEDAKSNK
ncbi:hypothetical protein MKX03_006951, partial [Papaver bracteatum]